jgi:hypothetical protein
MKIKTNYSDLAKGKRRSARDCPVALAIRRYIGDKDVTVSVDGYVLIEGHKYSLPDHVRRFISLFDENIDVSPIEFELVSDEEDATTLATFSALQLRVSESEGRLAAQDMAIADKNQTIIHLSEEIKKQRQLANDALANLYTCREMRDSAETKVFQLENALKEVTENIVANTQKALNSKQEKLDQLDAALDSWIKLADERFKLIRGKNDKILALEAETRRWSEAEKETARKHQEQCSLYVGRIQELEGILESKQNLVSALAPSLRTSRRHSPLPLPSLYPRGLSSNRVVPVHFVSHKNQIKLAKTPSFQ